MRPDSATDTSVRTTAAPCCTPDAPCDACCVGDAANDAWNRALDRDPLASWFTPVLCAAGRPANDDGAL